MHENEFPISEDRVQGLLESQCPQWANLHLSPLSSGGTDHALFRLGAEYLVRLPRVEWTPGSVAKRIFKEYTWVPRLAAFLKTPVSEPIFQGAPMGGYPWPWLILRWNEGDTPSYETESQNTLLAQDLAYFLNELHAIELPGGPPSRRGVDLKALDAETKQAIRQLEGEIDVPFVSSLWGELCSVAPCTQAPVWIHGDLLPGNILVKQKRLIAVIDFSDVGVGDPACDLIIAWSLFNRDSREAFKAHLNTIDEDTWERGRGWALSIALIILPYYKHSHPSFARLAQGMLENVINH